MKKYFLFVILVLLMQNLQAQLLSEETTRGMNSSAPTAIDFSKMFRSDQESKEEFKSSRSQQESEIQQRLSAPAALEKAVDPNTYIVGPGDIFSFNIWGAMEMKMPVMVSPEGKLAIPSVGEVDVDGLLLSEAKVRVLEKAKPFYEKCEISLSLEKLRYFKVHVTGAVKYPGTYMGNPTSRIPELIEEAGGIYGWANKAKVELRRENGDTLFFNLSEFEATGKIISDLFVNGGDVVFVPPVALSAKSVTVAGDFKKGGNYPLLEKETIYDFLLRIGPFSRSANISQVSIIRMAEGQKQIIKPFSSGEVSLLLEDGDRVVVPSDFVYVKGAVQTPGAFPYVANLTARDYAGMAGGNYQSASIKSVKVYNSYTGKMKKGPDTIVEAGDVVDLPQSWGNRFRDVASIISTMASVVLAAKAVGVIGD